MKCETPVRDKISSLLSAYYASLANSEWSAYKEKSLVISELSQ